MMTEAALTSFIATLFSMMNPIGNGQRLDTSRGLAPALLRSRC